MSASPSPEFRLVCACCRWPRGAARDEGIRAAAAAAPIDWERFAQIVRRQRVWGLVADALPASGVAIPADLAGQLAEHARRLLQLNLAAVSATAEIGAAFDAAAIDWISFKGLPLATRAYRSLGVKVSTDIDILVPEADAVRACALLADMGYRRFHPGPEVADDQLGGWMKACKESGWRQPVTGRIVEIHGRVMANPALLPEAGLDAPRTSVEVHAGVTVPTFAEPLHFAYLVAHGAHHGWFRLKWLADVAALLGDDPAAIETQYREAQAFGVGRCAAQALLLAHDLLALPLAPAFEAELRAHRVHRRLVAIALGAMAGDYEAREHANAAARTMLPVTLGNLLLRRGLGYKWSEIASLAANPKDRATGRLPPALGFLYPLIGGMRWGARMLGLKPQTAP